MDLACLLVKWRLFVVGMRGERQREWKGREQCIISCWGSWDSVAYWGESESMTFVMNQLIMRCCGFELDMFFSSWYYSELFGGALE